MPTLRSTDTQLLHEAPHQPMQSKKRIRGETAKATYKDEQPTDNTRRGEATMIYELSYGSYEDSERYLLQKERKLGDRPFDDDVHEATLKVIKEKMTDGKVSKYELHFDSLIDPVKNKLVEDYGYTEILPDATFNIFGWASVVEKDDWEYDRDEKLNKLTDYLNGYGINEQIIK